ncbi:hypothetical protein BI036_gp173 [Morganella phage vB_MmoM_MP1]|uniref:Uncharacterized protein n=1 Tax=Morganella phage vB_MmoM_MP1 TaxID=1852628 RepID=A0A192YAM9_9CAUD|nr:hypothetical protein BI036_gp173 [Morganella phage vB_MmoM_MP1]ANM46587.1 hypothetical protein MP1_gp0221 [Morganella phage vB_MmoM_MP1]
MESLSDMENLSNYGMSTSSLMVGIINEIYSNNPNISKGRVVAKANNCFATIFPNSVDWTIDFNETEFTLNVWFIIECETVIIHNKKYGWDL